jgi:hypothetical protein
VTTIAAPPRRARGTVTRAPARTRRPAPPRTAAPARTATRARTAAPARAHAPARPHAIGRLGALLALLTVFAVVTAVVFHVVLAQKQLELDRLNQQITKEQRIYEQRSLSASLLASPQRIIQEAQRLGLVVPDQPAEYLQVEGAPPLQADDGSTANTFSDWSKTKSSLGPQQP